MRTQVFRDGVTSHCSPRRRVGPGRLLACGYALFVLAAGGRGAVQLADAVTAARVLSAVAALVYATGLALVLLAERGRARGGAALCASIELAGVLLVGVLSLAIDDLADTVWAHFGAGYLFVPLALPLAVLVWLRTGCRLDQPTRM